MMNWITSYLVAGMKWIVCAIIYWFAYFLKGTFSILGTLIPDDIYNAVVDVASHFTAEAALINTFVPVFEIVLIFVLCNLALGAIFIFKTVLKMMASG